MNEQEFQALAAVERRHWFYRGKRRIVKYWLQRLDLCAKDWIVDVGAGTGILLGDLNQPERTLGVEYSPIGIHFAKRNTSAKLITGSATDLPIPTGWAGLVIALDVIEHIEDDRLAVAEMARIIRPGGYLIINVPAFQSLWSDWDKALGHWRRYSIVTLQNVVSQPGLAIQHISYTNWLAFAPIWLYRRWRTLFAPNDNRRLEDSVPTPFVNFLLEAAFVYPACWPWFRPPVGVSIFCILQRTEKSL